MSLSKYVNAVTKFSLFNLSLCCSTVGKPPVQFVFEVLHPVMASCYKQKFLKLIKQRLIQNSKGPTRTCRLDH